MIDIHSLAPDAGVLLHRDATAVPAIEVREKDGVRWLHFGGRAVQSAMYTQQPARVALPYLQCMLTALLFSAGPSRLLNLGLGGGAFNRFFQQHMPGLEIVSVEQDPRVAAIAGQYFGVDCRACHIETAEQFLARAVMENAGCAGNSGSDCERGYDLVLCDLYAEDTMPRLLQMPETYQQFASLAAESAVLAINLLPTSEPQLLTVLQLARAAFPAIALLEVPDYRNIVLLAAQHSLVQRQEPGTLKDWLPDVETFLATLRRLPDGASADC